jgi:thioester reductase-like protein
MFMSSIAAVPYWLKLHPNQLVPEEFIHDLEVAELGYGESKLISELVLEKGGDISGTRSTILRIGHITGPISGSGMWNKNEWVPAVSDSLICAPK